MPATANEDQLHLAAVPGQRLVVVRRLLLEALLALHGVLTVQLFARNAGSEVYLRSPWRMWFVTTCIAADLLGIP
jgi:hypothetical protein